VEKCAIVSKFLSVIEKNDYMLRNLCCFQRPQEKISRNAERKTGMHSLACLFCKIDPIYLEKHSSFMFGLFFSSIDAKKKRRGRGKVKRKRKRK
jgi:hypothetical protein